MLPPALLGETEEGSSGTSVSDVHRSSQTLQEPDSESPLMLSRQWGPLVAMRSSSDRSPAPGPPETRRDPARRAGSRRWNSDRSGLVRRTEPDRLASGMRPKGYETFNGLGAVMFPDELMHTSPLNLPGILNPAVLAVTAPENLSAVGLLLPPLTYPGQCLAEVDTSAAAPNVDVKPLFHVTVPPEASDAVGIGCVPPPVLAPFASVHPLMVMVPVAVPTTLVQTVLPFGPLAADAGPPLRASAAPETGMASAAASSKIRRICISLLMLTAGEATPPPGL